MQFTLNENESFTLLTCGACGTRHAISTPRYEELRRTKASFYCPNGHERAFVKSEVDTLREQLETLRSTLATSQQRLTQRTAERDSAERRAQRAEKALKKAAKVMP